jgi:hypothetical protein
MAGAALVVSDVGRLWRCIADAENLHRLSFFLHIFSVSFSGRSIPWGVVSAALLAGLAGRPERGWLPPLLRVAREDGPGGLVPIMPFRDLSGRLRDRQTTSSTPNPGFDERQVVLATL